MDSIGVRWIIAMLGLGIALLCGASAQACPKNQTQKCGPFHICICVPSSIAPVLPGGSLDPGGRAVEHLGNEASAQVAGAALEQWFNASRNSAIGGSYPVPPEVYAALSGFSDPGALARARFRIGDGGFFNVAHDALHAGSDVSAVTLEDVIVFRGPAEAADICLWAHELTHVDQFARQGVHDFSIRYVRDFHSEEDVAYQRENYCRANFGAWHGPSRPFPPVPFGNFCITPFGRFGPGPPQPVGSPCSVGGPNGPVPGQIGT